MSPSPTFVDLPTEVRLEIYQYYVLYLRRIHQRRQPTNRHFRLLRVCKQMYIEAKPIVSVYVSLLHERQIRLFTQTVPDDLVSLVVYADVANDGRLLRESDDKRSAALPLSQLSIALRRMHALKYLRVFECQQGLPIQLDSKYSRRFILEFEDAMFPHESAPQLRSYELYVSSNTKVTALKKVDASRMRKLRLSGSCSLARDAKTPALHDLKLQGVTGNYFDKHDFSDLSLSPNLDTFVYALEDRIGFEIRDSHVRSLAYGPGSNLRKLVLLGCTRVTSTALADSLQQMVSLEYFAIGIITVEEQRTNFALALPSSLSVFKLSITNAWYAVPLVEEERTLAVTIESRLRNRNLQLGFLALHIRPAVMNGGLQERLEALTQQTGCRLHVGPWTDYELS